MPDRWPRCIAILLLVAERTLARVLELGLLAREAIQQQIALALKLV